MVPVEASLCWSIDGAPLLLLLRFLLASTNTMLLLWNETNNKSKTDNGKSGRKEKEVRRGAEIRDMVMVTLWQFANVDLYVPAL